MPRNVASKQARQAERRREAKSCAECRRRRIGCVWTTDSEGSRGPRTCDNCLRRGRVCVPQSSKAPDPVPPSARDRISRLENDLASLTALVKDGLAQPSSLTSQSRDVPAPVDAAPAQGSGPLEVQEARPPDHLRLLFDNFAVDAHSEEENMNEQRNGSVERSIIAALSQLQPLLPSRQAISQLAPYARGWMDLYHSLFPTFFAYRSGDQLVEDYERMHHVEAHPVRLAMYLLCVAITAQQAPFETLRLAVHQDISVANWVNTICGSVQKAVVENDALAGTVEGLETIMLFVRLSIGRGNMKTIWLTLRRAIALAELIGLPRANSEAERAAANRTDRARATSGSDETSQLKVAVWETICATDRNFSLMLNLPAGTARYRFPYQESVWRDGQLSAQAYNYRLSAICSTIVEIDESYMQRDADAKSYEGVLKADHSLRALAASVPKTWWQKCVDDPLAELLVKFWHSYFLLRAHLRPAMLSDLDCDYAYSRAVCRDACQDALRRFTKFRSLLPRGFFVCRVIDVQAITAATFLLFSSLVSASDQSLPSSDNVVDPRSLELVQHVINCFATVGDPAGPDFAGNAVTTITSLMDFVQTQNHGQPKSLSLQIPLLGRVRIHRQGNRPAHQSLGGNSMNIASLQGHYQRTDPSSQLLGGDQTLLSEPAASLFWSFEFEGGPTWESSGWQTDGMVPVFE